MGQLAMHMVYLFYFKLSLLEGIFTNSIFLSTIYTIIRIQCYIMLQASAMVLKIKLFPKSSKFSLHCQLNALLRENIILNIFALNIDKAYRWSFLAILITLGPTSMMMMHMMLFDATMDTVSKMSLFYVIIFCYYSFFIITFSMSTLNRKMYGLANPVRQLATLAYSSKQMAILFTDRLRLAFQFEYFHSNYKPGITIGGFILVTRLVYFKV